MRRLTVFVALVVAAVSGCGGGARSPFTLAASRDCLSGLGLVSVYSTMTPEGRPLIELAVDGKDVTVLFGRNAVDAADLARTYRGTKETVDARRANNVAIVWMDSPSHAEIDAVERCLATAAQSPVVAQATVPRPASSAGTGGCNWRVVESAPREASWSAVAAVSPRDVWVVGGTSERGRGRPVIAHWDGRALHVTAAFQQAAPARAFALKAITAVSVDDVWAVGSQTGRPVVVHWDGRGWQSVPTPELSGEADLAGVVAFSGTDVWAVGSVGTFPQNQALVMHWDGQTWRTWNLHPPASSLFAIDGTSSQDLWVVGDAHENGHQLADQQPLAVHWDGRSWRGSSAFSGTPSDALWVIRFDSIDARSASDIWTIADDEDSSSDVLRWNGTRQRLVYTYTDEGSLSDIAVVSPRDVWAVGQLYEPNPPLDRPLVVHWNGTHWRTVKTPLDALDSANLKSLSILSPTDIWAVGNHLVARYSCSPSNGRR